MNGVQCKTILNRLKGARANYNESGINIAVITEQNSRECAAISRKQAFFKIQGVPDPEWAAVTFMPQLQLGSQSIPGYTVIYRSLQKI